MKLQLLFLVVATLSLSVSRTTVGADKDPKISPEDEFMQTMAMAPYDDVLARIRGMNQEEKAKIIRAVRENKSGMWGQGELHLAYVSVLFYLGDPEERRREVAEFRRIPSHPIKLAALGEPWVIEEFAPDMFREEEYPTVSHGDSNIPPLSYGATWLIIDNLRNATVYRPEVVLWAKQAYMDERSRAVMRDWWSENERFFKEKNYQEVKPGRPLVRPAPVQSAPPSNSLPIQPGTPPPAPAPLPAPQPSPTNHWSPAIVIASLLALLGAGVIGFRSRSQS